MAPTATSPYASYSWWLETCGDDLTPRPPLDGPIDVDVAILPIGAYHPPSFRYHHVSPEDALEAMRLMKAKHLLPVHYGAFDLSWEPFEEPPLRMAKVAKEAGLEDRVHVVPPGTTLEF